MGKNALVLGGGGALGVAWETGILMGLLDAGVDVTGADLIVGTSAGSIVGTHVAAGRTIEDLIARQNAPDDGQTLRLIAQIDFAASRNLWTRWAGITEITPTTRAEIGQMALEAKTAPEELWVGMFREQLEGIAWPDRALILTAVDCASGDFQQWNRESGVDITLAVASSCAVPGLFPAVTINGKRYTDGGLRSGTSADLASGYDAVLIVAPIGARPDGIDPILGRQARAEAEALRAAGSQVELVFPEGDAIELMGSRMDVSKRGPAAEAGIRQAKALAPRLADAWAKAAV